MSEGATRSMAYVALSRGSTTNPGYIYSRDTTEADANDSQPSASAKSVNCGAAPSTQPRISFGSSQPTMTGHAPCTSKPDRPDAQHCYLAVVLASAVLAALLINRRLPG
jgi:hypothetical protein